MNIQAFHDACTCIYECCPDPYARSYARAGLDMQSERMIHTQALYILNNISHWRGDIAKATRANLKDIVKQGRD